MSYLTLKAKVNSPQNNRGLNEDDELWRRQARGQHTDKTDAGNKITPCSKLASG